MCDIHRLRKTFRDMTSPKQQKQFASSDVKAPR